MLSFEIEGTLEDGIKVVEVSVNNVLSFYTRYTCCSIFLYSTRVIHHISLVVQAFYDEFVGQPWTRNYLPIQKNVNLRNP